MRSIHCITLGAFGAASLLGAPAFGVQTAEREQLPQSCPADAPSSSAEEIALLIEASLDALPADATEAQIRAAIEAAIRNCADPVAVTVALGTVAANNAAIPAVVAAATAAAQTQDPGAGPTAGGGSAGGGNPTPPPASQGGGGGNSDY